MLEDEAGLTERRMFGGLALLVGGHIVVGVYGDGLLVRAPGDDQERLLAEPGVTTYAMGGQPMVGWVLVGVQACAEDDALRRWVARGLPRPGCFAGCGEFSAPESTTSCISPGGRGRV